MYDGGQSFQSHVRRRREESKRRSGDSLDEFFDMIEEVGKRVYEEYDKARKEVIKMSFFMGLLGGLCGGATALGLFLLFS